VASEAEGKTAASISLVSGALGLTLVPLVGAVVAIIAGHVARTALPPGHERRRVATLGMALGFLGLLAPLLVIAFASSTSSAGASDAELACRQALERGAPFVECSRLIDDLPLAAGFQGLASVEPSARAERWTSLLRESSVCRSAPCDGGVEPASLAVEGFVRACRSLSSETRAVVEAQLPRAFR
jgi:hypothetical protein